jgi:hypothetical protein
VSGYIIQEILKLLKRQQIAVIRLSGSEVFGAFEQAFKFTTERPKPAGGFGLHKAAQFHLLALV